MTDEIPVLQPITRRVLKLDPEAWADETSSHRLNAIETYAYVCACGLYCPDVEAALTHLKQVGR